MAADESSADTLRLQFKAMQELQHRRLQKQMERKREKELSCQSKADDQEGLMVIPDGLSLLNTEEQNLKNIFEKRVLEDEIQQLRNELRETVDENGRLYKLLKERDFEIKHLKKKIEEDRLAFTGTTGMAGDLVATKIVELSKKNRGLMAESESAKVRIKQLTNHIQELEHEPQPVCSSRHSPAVLVPEELEWYLRLEQAFAAFPESKVPKPCMVHPGPHSCH